MARRDKRGNQIHENYVCPEHTHVSEISKKYPSLEARILQEILPIPTEVLDNIFSLSLFTVVYYFNSSLDSHSTMVR